jgi:hypothetical protein
VVEELSYRPEVSIYLILPAAMALGLAQSLAEMSNRSREIMFLMNRARPLHKADNFTAVGEPIV